MSKSKRGIEMVDLTGDDDPVETPAFKTPRKTSSFSSTHGRGNHLPTPPASSQPRLSSQSGARPSPASSQSYASHRSIHQDQVHSQSERGSWIASTQEQEADIAREIDLTEDFDDDIYENYQLYGILNTKIVGCRFYDGRATVGEYVKVRREPRNAYDSNAIRIDNVLRDQIGHVARNVAAKLASLMDSGSLLIEGALTGPKTFYDCPIGLKLFGTSDPVAGPALAQQMKALGLPLHEFNKSEK